MSSVLTEIITLLTSGLTAMGTGIGKGLNDIVTSMFLVKAESGGGTTLSTFGGIIVVFAGIGLAVGLTKLIYHFICSLGATGK